MNLDAYRARIGHAAPTAPDLSTLRALHQAHVTAIPFENLDIQMGLPVRLDVESVEAKLVLDRRGGYCFEQNTLFLHVLRAIGFDVTPCEARVRSGSTRVGPRTHMVLVVRLESRDWLVDVGFGADGLSGPLPMDGTEHEQFGVRYRMGRESTIWLLQSRAGGVWSELYAFPPEGREPVDFEVGNWYTSTYPQSSFVKTLTVQRVAPDARHVLRNLTYTVRRGLTVTTTEIPRSALVSFLREQFGLVVPVHARFRALDGEPHA
jgi:N-hydroxyarylamine O-acetyltransferase